MLSRRGFVSCALCAAGGLLATGVSAQAAPGGVARTILQTTDGPMDGYVTVLARADIDAGATVMRHTHPGIESAYVLAGGGILQVKGLPDREVKPGDSFQVPPYTPHMLRNGAAPTQIASTYVVEKDKPLASPAPE